MGNNNSAFGQGALYNAETGSSNIAIGFGAGGGLVSGSGNIYVGAAAVSASESGVIRIGDGVSQTELFVPAVSGSTVASGVAVYVNSSGQLGTATSSVRYKEEITSMDEESAVLMKLRPVAFYYKPPYDGAHTRQYGLVAEEVAEVAPQLVAYDEDGAPQTVRYHFVNAMLLNEVQKQRRENEEQRTTIRGLEARLARLEAALAGDR
jgi:hypothetical protein